MTYRNRTFRIAARLVVLLDDAKGISVSTKEIDVQEPIYQDGEEGQGVSRRIDEGTEEMTVSAGTAGDMIRLSFKWSADYSVFTEYYSGRVRFTGGVRFLAYLVGDVYYGRGAVQYSKTNEIDFGVYSSISLAAGWSGSWWSGPFVNVSTYADGGPLPRAPSLGVNFDTVGGQDNFLDCTVLCMNFIICKKSLVAATGTVYNAYGYSTGDKFDIPTEYRGYGECPETRSRQLISTLVGASSDGNTYKEVYLTAVAKSERHQIRWVDELYYDLGCYIDGESSGDYCRFRFSEQDLSGTYDSISSIFCTFSSRLISLRAEPYATSFTGSNIIKWSNAYSADYFSQVGIDADIPRLAINSAYGALFLTATGAIDASVFTSSQIDVSGNVRIILPSIPAFSPIMEENYFIQGDTVGDQLYVAYEPYEGYTTNLDIDVLPEMFADDYYDCGFLMFDVSSILPFLSLPYRSSTNDGFCNLSSYLEYLYGQTQDEYETWIEYYKDTGKWKSFVDYFKTTEPCGLYNSVISRLVKQLSGCVPKYTKNLEFPGRRKYDVPPNKFVLKELISPERINSTTGRAFVFASMPGGNPYGESARAVFYPLGVAENSCPPEDVREFFYKGMYIPTSKRRKYLSTVKATFVQNDGTAYPNMAVLYLATYNSKTPELARCDTDPDGVGDPSRLTRLDDAENYPRIDNDTRNEVAKENGSDEQMLLQHKFHYEDGIIRNA